VQDDDDDKPKKKAKKEKKPKKKSGHDDDSEDISDADEVLVANQHMCDCGCDVAIYIASMPHALSSNALQRLPVCISHDFSPVTWRNVLCIPLCVLFVSVLACSPSAALFSAT
jgi:hypothetical protein